MHGGFPRGYGKQASKPLVQTASSERAPEWIEVVLWRYERLRREGYPAAQAMDLAEARTVDLHQACQMLRQGCSPERAMSILL